MKYFDDSEFVCKCCGELPEDGMNPVLLEKLDELREMIGFPIYISSAYRCPEHNREVGGVSNSQHTKGNACDLVCSAVTVDELAEAAVEVGFDGIGVYHYDGFVHVDTRDDGLSPNEYRW